MNYPNKSESLALLDAWVVKHAEVVKLWTALEVTIGADHDGPLMHTLWTLFDTYTQTLAKLLGDASEWMQWYQVENDMGAKGMDAGYDKRLLPIKTTAHLFRLIEESRKRAAA